MTVAEIRNHLALHQNRLVDFGIRFITYKEATKEEQEYPEGEEQDSDGKSEAVGLGVGLGIKYAIYHNFVVNRPAAEFRAFLKNHRIPKHTKFAKELERVFAEVEGLNTHEA